MKSVTLLFLLSFCIPTINSAQDPEIKPVTKEKIDLIFEEFDHPQTPGCAVGVTHLGELIFSEGYGTANLDYGIEITPASRFMIASISKQFAAASLLMMEQEGLIDLDEDLRSHIPEISQFDKPVTARQIIHHTSGIRDIYTLLLMADIGLDNTTTKEQALELLSKQQKLNFSPGGEHLYSNMAYFLTSVIVEKFSKKTLRDYSREHFFDPIGMQSTHWHDDTELIVPNRVISYRSTEHGPGMFYRGNMDRVGARGLFTTIEDFAKWDANFIENKSNLENFNQKMTAPGFTTKEDSINYASGLRLGRYKTFYTVGHGGNYMGFRSHYVRFPDHQLGITVFCNMNNISPSGYAYEVADLYLEDEFSDMFSEYTGTYVSPSLGNSFVASTVDGDFYLERKFGDSRELSWEKDDTFRSGSWQIQFKRNDGGIITGFEVETPQTGSLTYIRQ